MGLSFSSILTFFSNEKEIRLLMVGLDHAGKTTILYKLKLGEIVNSIPTIGFNLETIKYKNIHFTVWDLGNGDKFRPLWYTFYGDSKGVIFVVDSADRKRIEEAGRNLNYLLSQEELQDAILLVIANKQDVSNCMSASEIADKLQLYKMGSRKWYVQTASAIEGEGLWEGVHWLANVLTIC